MIYLYTDGACSGNPGPGGYAAILEKGPHRKEIAEGFRQTTNNRMELLAVIAGLEALTRPGLEVTVVSDSRYVVDAINKGWLFNWERKGYDKVKNPDLWQRFLRIYRKHKVTMVWVKGHNEHPQNERADQLAVAASKQPTLRIDEGFERSSGLF